MTEETTDYALRAHLDMPLEKALPRVESALKDEGFGVLTTIDVKTTFKEKLDIDFRSYRILGVCNPSLALQALNANLDAGLLLPCNVILFEEGGGTEVAILNPLSILCVGDGLGIGIVVEEARDRLQRVAKALTD